MVLKLKEYTMARLGYESAENPLISVIQTRPPLFFKYRTLHSSSSSIYFFFLLRPARSPTTLEAAADGDGGEVSLFPFTVIIIKSVTPSSLRLLRSSFFPATPTFSGELGGGAW